MKKTATNSTQASAQDGKTEKSKRGRKPKNEKEKASFKVGSFWLTPTEKSAYMRLFTASGLQNQTEFFRRVMFEGRLKLHYTDTNSSLIYAKITTIQKEMNAIGTNINQVVTRINSVISDQSFEVALRELREKQDELEKKMQEMFELFEKFSPRAPGFEIEANARELRLIEEENKGEGEGEVSNEMSE